MRLELSSTVLINDKSTQILPTNMFMLFPQNTCSCAVLVILLVLRYKQEDGTILNYWGFFTLKFYGG